MKPIIFSGSNLQFVSAYDGTDHEQWNATSGPVVELRRFIREHYIVQQGFRCAYCRVRRQEIHGLLWDVEHVIPKSKYPRYLYEPRNLALVCKECNMAKGDKEVLLGKFRARTAFADDSNDYLIVHPHFDSYTEHIDIARFQDKMLFNPKTVKGERTIYMCELLRFSYKYGGWTSFDDTLVKDVSEFIDKFPRDTTAEAIKAAVRHIVKPESVDFNGR